MLFNLSAHTLTLMLMRQQRSFFFSPDNWSATQRRDPRRTRFYGETWKGIFVLLLMTALSWRHRPLLFLFSLPCVCNYKTPFVP